jgi:hypothetical protein
MEQLKDPRMNVLIVKPLVERLFDEDDVSVGMSNEDPTFPKISNIFSLLPFDQPHAVLA